MIPFDEMPRAEPLLMAAEARYADINLTRLQQLGMVTHEGGRTGVAEDFRIIKRPLLRSARGLDGPPVPHYQEKARPSAPSTWR
jgi:protein-tyrosine kinase